MTMPAPEPSINEFHQLAVRLTVVEVAVAALIGAAPETNRATVALALATLETLSLDGRSGLPAPQGIAECLRTVVGLLATQGLGSDWRRYAFPSQLPNQTD
jgi:hypothetical protein